MYTLGALWHYTEAGEMTDASRDKVQRFMRIHHYAVMGAFSKTKKAIAKKKNIQKVGIPDNII